MNAVRDVWEEFQRPDMKGLISNCVCLFPSVGRTEFAKEINISAWESSKAAHDWYAESSGHQNIMRQHTGGFLKTFGNLLASLEPTRPLRVQDRCRRCFRVIENEREGGEVPSRCACCGARSFGYPTF